MIKHLPYRDKNKSLNITWVRYKNSSLLLGFEYFYWVLIRNGRPKGANSIQPQASPGVGNVPQQIRPARAAEYRQFLHWTTLTGRTVCGFPPPQALPGAELSCPFGAFGIVRHFTHSHSVLRYSYIELTLIYIKKGGRERILPPSLSIEICINHIKLIWLQE